MLRIALIDDKSYGLKQIEARHAGEAFTLEYFSSFREFSAYRQKFDLVYLDFYLEKDGLTADQIFPQVQELASQVIAFSSVPRRNQELCALGAALAVQKEMS